MKIKKLSPNLRTLLIMGVKRAGSYSVPEVFAAVEEQMTGEEAAQAEAFLTWLTKSGLQFGHGNLEQRWAEWQASMGRTVPTPRAKQQSIHEALELPSPYHVRVAVEGHIEKVHYRLRIMSSPTGGAETVHALSVSWGPWQETSGEEWMRLAKRIIEP